MASPIPQAKTSDSEDVSWALQTAESQWARGDREEALKWLRRAVESASEGEDDMRALELAKAAAELTAPPPPSVPAPPSVSRPPPPPRSGPSVAPQAPRSGPSVAPPRPSGAPPRPSGAPPAPRSSGSVAPQRPTASRVAPTATPRPVAARTVPGPKDAKSKEEQRKSARKSHAGEVQRGRGAADEATHTHDMVFTATHQADAAATQQADAAATQQTDAAPGPTVTEGHAHRDAMATAPPEVPGDAVGADAWPTEAIKGADMPSFEHERTRIGAAAYHSESEERPVSGPRTSQAIRVVLYRAADGTLRLAPAGTEVSAVTVEAMLVAMDPEVELRTWLTSK